MRDLQSILNAYGLRSGNFSIRRLTAGHIHETYKLEGTPGFILQRINKNVFTKPDVIASNLRAAANHLDKYHPGYLFLSAVKTADGFEMVYDHEDFPWRLFPYIENTFTVDAVRNESEAFQAASKFAEFARNLNGADLSQFKPTIERFHDLSWRFEQFETALQNASPDRLQLAKETIIKAKNFAGLVSQYEKLIQDGSLTLRIMHNDTKINNILFNADTLKAVCVIDLDTLMPGYFIYDLGDMIRTFVSPVSEEEKDLTKVIFRKEIYNALVDGYLSKMEDLLNTAEKSSVAFGGMMMTYIMALRMLTDFLNRDTYYHTTYPGQNLVRSKNQFRLLETLADHL